MKRPIYMSSGGLSISYRIVGTKLILSGDTAVLWDRQNETEVRKAVRQDARAIAKRFGQPIDIIDYLDETVPDRIVERVSHE